ncbi:MAG: carboxypeptidase-like regulatory domain-containing protein, partial [Candidatus Sulfotelmatobacter sp.]
LRVGASLFLLGGLAIAQNAIAPSEIPCSEETVTPNLELANRTRVAGQLKDATGAPFADSKVHLRMAGAKGKFVAYRTVTTNKEGQFDLGFVDAGKYRLLPAPNRGFKQPKEVRCYEGRDCELNLVLLANPTDQPFAGCPIQ